MATDILQSIPSLVAAKDAAALVALEDHSDKEIRKAARKGIHTLRSRGVAIPTAAAARSWASGANDALRGELREAAMIDTESTPGLVRILIAAPQAEERGYLWVAGITGRDMVADFTAYVQTDGQRARLIRDWEQTGDRRVPASWARARIRWAREQTLASGFSVPTQLDDMLVHLGSPVTERPASFLTGKLSGSFRGDKDNVEAVLIAARAFQWPPMFDVEPILQKVNQSNPAMNAETPESERYDALMAAAAGEEGLRAGLQVQVANLLEDAGHALWLHGVDDRAAEALALANELRTSGAPEALPWIGRLLGFQIASTLAYIQRQQQQQRGQ
jgi:hypothetical protein